MKQIVKVTLIILIIFSYFTTPAVAQVSFNLVFPVRGKDFWREKRQPSNKVKEFVNFLNKNNLPATFLLRFDALNDQKIIKILKDNQSKINLGVFLEVSPSLAQTINLPYPKDDNRWYYPDRVFPVAYSLKQRYRIIDAYINKFREVFTTDPVLIGAWYIDSTTLHYLYNHYGIKSFLIVSDQNGTDHYFVWGLPFGRNYHPSFLNPLVPGNSPLTIYQWAPRDISLGLNNSLYSLQTNDYLKLNLNLNYWFRIINDYSKSFKTQPFVLIIGLENDESNPQAYQDLFRGIKLLKKKGAVFNYSFKRTPSNFFDIFINQDDKGDQTSYLVQTKNYRIYLKSDKKQTLIYDLRSLIGNNYPSFWNFYPNRGEFLFAQNDALIDNFQLNNFVRLPFAVTWNEKKKSFSSNGESKIRFLEDRITFNMEVPKKLREGSLAFPGIRINKTSLVFVNFYKNFNKIHFQLAIGWLIGFSIIGFLLLRRWFSRTTSFYLLVLTLIWSFPLIRSGLPTKYGLGFWGPNGHDAIWHLALVQSILKGFPIKQPTLSGYVLSNYHFGLDLVLAFLYKVSHLPLTFLYFRFLPLLMALAILVLSHKLYLQLFKTKKGVLFSLFFIVNAGSFGFVVSFIKHQPLGGESAFWANQAVSTLLNPPFASSLVFILITLLLMLKDKKTTKDFLFIFLLPALTLWFKVYGGLFLGLVVGVWTIGQFIRFKKSKTIFPLSLVGLFLFFLSLKALTSGRSLIVFKPLWFIINMFIFPDRVGWLRFGRALTTYLQSFSPKLLVALPVALIIFYVGNFGMRILSAFSFKYIGRNKRDFFIALWIAIILFSIVPLFIIQKGTPWNSIQFLYYPLFFTAFLSGTFFINLPKTLTFKNFKFQIKNLVTIVIMVMTIPTTISTLSYYLPKTPHACLPWEEIKALYFLSKQPPGVVISPPYNPYLKDIYFHPTPLFAYTDTAYVTAFSGKITYLADTMNLDISGYDYEEREKLLKKLYDPRSSDNLKNKILTVIAHSQPNIRYIYLLHLPAYKLSPSPPWHKIYQNSLVEVWKK